MIKLEVVWPDVVIEETYMKLDQWYWLDLRDGFGKILYSGMGTVHCSAKASADGKCPPNLALSFQKKPIGQRYANMGGMWNLNRNANCFTGSYHGQTRDRLRALWVHRFGLDPVLYEALE